MKMVIRNCLFVSLLAIICVNGDPLGIYTTPSPSDSSQEKPKSLDVICREVCTKDDLGKFTLDFCQNNCPGFIKSSGTTDSSLEPPVSTEQTDESENPKKPTWLESLCRIKCSKYEGLGHHMQEFCEEYCWN